MEINLILIFVKNLNNVIKIPYFMLLVITIISGTLLFLSLIYSVKWMIKEPSSYAAKLAIAAGVLSIISLIAQYENVLSQSILFDIEVQQKANLNEIEIINEKISREKVVSFYVSHLEKTYSVLYGAYMNTLLAYEGVDKMKYGTGDYPKIYDLTFPSKYRELLGNPRFLGYLNYCTIEHLFEQESAMTDIYFLSKESLLKMHTTEGFSKVCESGYDCAGINKQSLKIHQHYLEVNLDLLRVLFETIDEEEICTKYDSINNDFNDTFPELSRY